MSVRGFILALARGARGKEAAKALILPDTYSFAAQTGSGYDEFVYVKSGNPPLTLYKAAPKQMISLTASGNCDTLSTPTPSYPMDIHCNNGTFKMVDDELPSGYRRILGLTFNNDAYYVVDGFRLKGSDTLRFSFSASVACNVLGCYTSGSAQTNYSMYVGTSTAKYMRYNGGTYNSNIVANTTYNMVMTPTGATGLPTSSTWEEKSFTAESDMCIGTTSVGAASAKLTGSLYGNITVDGRLKLIPCERISDGVLGYYDTYSEAFIAPSAGTPVSLGYDGSHYSFSIVGTQSTVSVGTQSASVQTLLSTGTLNTKDTQEIISGTVKHEYGIMVCDGTEGWTMDGNYITIPSSVSPSANQYSGLTCTHYGLVGTIDFSNNQIRSNSDGSIQIYDSVNGTSASDYVSFLEAQYAKGTPVIFIYALKSEDKWTESVTAQPLILAKGTNIISATYVSNMPLAAEYYMRAQNLAGDIIEGYQINSSGVDSASSDYQIYNWIPVTAGMQYYVIVTSVKSAYKRIHLYTDIDTSNPKNTWIKQVSSANVAAGATKKISFTATSTTAYARISCSKGDTVCVYCVSE